MSALPYPTKHRLRLARAIRDKAVIEYVTEEPAFIYSKDEGRTVTVRVDELEAAGLATRDTPVQQTYFKVVALTPEGEAWLDRADKISTEGPGSTSPEPGAEVA